MTRIYLYLLDSMFLLNSIENPQKIHLLLNWQKATKLISWEFLYLFCYNPKLGSGCKLGKDLSKSRKDNQLVKCKDTGLYLQLYIPKDHKE